MEESAINNLKQKADEARKALNDLFVAKVRDQIVDKRSSKHADGVILYDPVKIDGKLLTTVDAYLVVICALESHAIIGSVIWSSPEWEQSRCRTDAYCYVALSSWGDSFEEAAKRLIKAALSPLFFYATGEAKALPVTINQIKTVTKQYVTTLRYARLLNYLPAAEKQLVATVISEDFKNKTQEFVNNYSTLIKEFLPDIYSKLELPNDRANSAVGTDNNDQATDN